MNVIFAISAAVLLFAFVFVVSTLFLMWGWGLFAVSYLGWQMITFSQAFGLILITGAIFGSGKASTSKEK